MNESIKKIAEFNKLERMNKKLIEEAWEVINAFEHEGEEEQVEEIADVQVVISQYIYLLSKKTNEEELFEKIKRCCDYKIERTIRLIETGELK